MHSGSRSLMVGVAVAFVATFWLLYRRYHFVRRVAVFMLGLAAFHFLVQLDRPWLVAVAGCLMLALAMRVWYRRTHPLVRSTRNANAREGWRDSVPAPVVWTRFCNSGGQLYQLVLTGFKG